jgi:drug/metabolite transporter (DMT)-like permease
MSYMYTTPRRESTLVLHVALLGVQVAFATLAVAGKIAINRRGISPEMLSFARCLGGALLFGVWDLARGGERSPMTRADLARLALAALLGVAGNQLLFLNGLRRTGAINAVLIVSTIPALTVLAGLLLGRERPSARTVAGIALSFAGILHLVGLDAVRLGVETITGDLLILANCASYALYLVIVRDLIARHGAPRVIPIAFALATLVVLPFAARDLARGLDAVPPGAWPVTLYIVLVPTAFAYFVNAWALGRARASVVAAYTYVQPLFASLFAVWLLDETLNARVGVAAALVFAGIGLVNFPRRTEPVLRLRAA